MTRTGTLKWFVLFFLVAWAILTIQINFPWFGHHDANGVWISAAVRNYEWYGALNIGLIPSALRYPIAPENLTFYTHHPPLIVWLAAGSSVLFGFSEMSVRFVPICLTMISAAAFFVFARRLLGVRKGFLATIFYTFVPMMLYFGRMPNHEAPALAFTLLFGAVLLAWLKDPTRKRWIVLAVCTVLSVWSAWAAILVIAFLGLAAWFLGASIHRRGLVGLAVVGFVAIIVLLLYYEWGAPGSINDLLNVFVFRSSTFDDYDSVSTFTAAEFIIKQLEDVFLNLTPGVILLGILGIVPLARYYSRRALTFTLALLGMAFVYMMLFRNAFFEHDFYKIYFVPPVAISASVGLAALQTRTKRQRTIRLFVISLLIASLIGGIVYVISLHWVATRSPYPTIVHNIEAYAESQDTIAINLRYPPIGLSYYVAKDILPNVMPDELAQRGVSLYVYCAADSPELFRDAPKDAYCYYLRYAQPPSE